MNEMIERVAGAAYGALLIDPESSTWPESGFSVDADSFRFAARAAISAMLLPTDAMAIAALKAVPPSAFLVNQLDYNLKVWEAMVAEGLRDE